MVEFGLKLEDNKVSEWSEFYIDYDKLKGFLKKAKAAEKKYEDLAKKRPDDAARIKEAYKSGNTDYVITTPAHSANNLAKVAKEATESTSLLVQSPTRGTENNDAEMTGEGSTGYLASAFDISGFFGSRYERNLRLVLKDIDDRGKKFEETLLSEIKKVSDFYASKLEELEARFQLLVEAVASSYDIDPLPPIGEHLDSQLPIRRGHNHRRKSGIMELVTKFTGMIKEESKKKKEDWAASLRVMDDNSDDEGDTQTPTKSKKNAGEADSIKRALIDHYRSAKLLHNFVIMNYTGFVKIVKKHDKSIPEQKGRFKEAIEPKNLFDEGKEVEELSNRFEKYFANWFCEGDSRAAHAQMLPKRGDGLEMDWSQLR
jgi:SPX domain protein involved in polyphosphate accumulation